MAHLLEHSDLKKIVGKGEAKAWSRSDLKWIVQGATYHSALLLGSGIGALIMLALATHEPHFTILRELVLDRKAAEKRKERQE